jgi:WD40 repeat protein
MRCQLYAISVVGLCFPGTTRAAAEAQFLRTYQEMIMPIVREQSPNKVCQTLQEKVFAPLECNQALSLKNYCLQLLRWRAIPCIHRDIVSSAEPAMLVAVGHGSSSHLATGTPHSAIRIYDQAALNKVQQIFFMNRTRHDAMTGLAYFDHDSKIAATFLNQGAVTWDVATHNQESNFADDTKITAFMMMKENPVAICGCTDGSHQIYDLRTKDHPISSIKLHWSPVRSLAQLGNSEHFVTCADEDIMVWDLRELSKAQSLFYKRSDVGFNAVSGCQMESIMVIGDAAGNLDLWDIAHQERLMWSEPSPERKKPKIKALAGAPCAPAVAVLSGNKWYVWDYGCNKTINIGTDFEKMLPCSVQSLVFSEDGSKLFAAHKALHVWIAHNSFDRLMKVLAEENEIVP